MKTFATLCLTAAVVSAWGKHDVIVEPEVVDETPFVPETVTIEQINEDVEENSFWKTIRQDNELSRQLWLGIFNGLYGMSGSVDRPTEDCFGEWIPEKMEQLSQFRAHLHESLFDIDMDEAATASYNMVDLVFLNDRYCHFRQTIYDVKNYCDSASADSEDGVCDFGTVMENAQKNAFSIITEVSSAAGVFKQQPWEEMDEQAKGYAVNELSHSMAKLFSDLIGFNASKVVSH